MRGIGAKRTERFLKLVQAIGKLAEIDRALRRRPRAVALPPCANLLAANDGKDHQEQDDVKEDDNYAFVHAARPASAIAPSGTLSSTSGTSSRRSGLRDELGDEVGAEAFGAALAAVTAFLDAAEWCLRRRDHHRVDADHAGFQRVADLGRSLVR